MESKYQNNTTSPLIFLAIFFLIFIGSLFGAWQLAKNDFVKFSFSNIFEDLKPEPTIEKTPTELPNVPTTTEAEKDNDLSGIYEGSLDIEEENYDAYEKYKVTVQEDLSFNMTINGSEVTKVTGGSTSKKYEIKFIGQFDKDTLKYETEIESYGNNGDTYVDSITMVISNEPRQNINYKFIRKDKRTKKVITEQEKIIYRGLYLPKDPTPTPTEFVNQNNGTYRYTFPSEEFNSPNMLFKRDITVELESGSNTVEATIEMIDSSTQDSGKLETGEIEINFTGELQEEDQYKNTLMFTKDIAESLKNPKAKKIMITITSYKSTDSTIRVEITYLNEYGSAIDTESYHVKNE